MANSKNKKVTNKKQKGEKIKTFVALALVGVVVAGTCCVGYASRDVNGKWFKNSNFSTWHWADNESQINYGDWGLIVSDGESNGVSIARSRIAPANYSEYGISAQSESAYTLVATITPSSADDKSVEWTVAPVSGNLNASDYITLTSSGLTATVSCKQAFDVQFIVTVKSVDNPEAKATCTLDYVQRVTGVTVNMPKLTSTASAVTYNIEGSKYTVKSDTSVSFNNFNFNTSFAEEYYESTYGDWYGQFLHPTYTSQLVKYTANGVEFINSSTISALSEYDVCIDGLIGCFYRISSKDLNSVGDTTGDIISYFMGITNRHYIGTVDITVNSMYNGTVNSTVTKSVEIWIDGASLHIPVAGVALNNGSIIF